MTVVHVPDPNQYQFLGAFRWPDVTTDESNQSFTFDNSVLADLVQRLVSGRASVLPYMNGNDTSWMIVGGNTGDLDRTMERASRFVLPTYAVFAEDIARRIAFDPQRASMIQRLGSQLFPDGYYRWKAINKHNQQIFEQLQRWLRIEATSDRNFQPDLSERLNYARLFRRFEAALSVTDWESAEAVILQMQKQMLTSAENIQFLRIQLLAKQQRWLEIWHYPRRPQLVTGRVPRAVRAALLTGFYVTNLKIHENAGEWKTAFDTYRRESAALGKLLTTRDGLTQNAVISIFAYQAVYEENLVELDVLKQLTDDLETRRTLGALELLLPQHPSVAVSSPEQRVKDALYRGQYDLALSLADELADPVERLAVRLTVASEADDAYLIRAVLDEYDAMYPEDHVLLRDAFHLDRKVEKLRANVPGSIETWGHWLDLALQRSNAPQLSAAIETLPDPEERSQWAALTEKLGALLVAVDSWNDPRWMFVNEALERLTTYFIEHLEDVPATYSELYETLYAIACEQGDTTSIGCNRVLRLAEARLKFQQSQLTSTFERLKSWLPRPIPALEAFTFEAFDLFGDQGLDPLRLIDWFREWMPVCVNRPNCDLASVFTWRTFCQWIQPGYDQLQSLDEALARLQQNTSDTISELPKGYKIAIYSLQRSSVERAKAVLLDRNPDLDIRGYYETHPNEMMRATARDAQQVVIVSSCITHAVTHTIVPLAQERLIYSTSRGTDSIVRAIESAALKFSLP